MRWAGHVVRIREIKVAYIIFISKLKRSVHLEEPNADVRKILKWILGK
jgi:hypothetical protein